MGIFSPGRKIGFFRGTEWCLRKKLPDTNILGVVSSKEMAKSHPIHPKVISNTELTARFCSFSFLNMSNHSHVFIEVKEAIKQEQDAMQKE